MNREQLDEIRELLRVKQEQGYCPECHCDAYETPRDPNDEGAYPGPDLDCECECH